MKRILVVLQVVLLLTSAYCAQSQESAQTAKQEKLGRQISDLHNQVDALLKEQEFVQASDKLGRLQMLYMDAGRYQEALNASFKIEEISPQVSNRENPWNYVRIAEDVMKEIKKALDPNNILNPRKMGFDDSIKDIFECFAFQPLIDKPDEIQTFRKALDNEIMACIMCGFCRAGCPTYGETSLESINARGRIILAYHLLTGKLKPSKELAERFYKCTTCLNCNPVCPAGVKVADIIEDGRVEVLAPDMAGHPMGVQSTAWAGAIFLARLPCYGPRCCIVESVQHQRV